MYERVAVKQTVVVFYYVGSIMDRMIIITFYSSCKAALLFLSYHTCFRALHQQIIDNPEAAQKTQLELKM